LDVTDLLPSGYSWSSVSTKESSGLTIDEIVLSGNDLNVTISDGFGYLIARLIAERDPESLAECYAALNALKDAYEAHRVSTTHHSVENSTDAIAADDATSFATAVTLADELKTDYNLHRTDNSEDAHLIDDDTNVVTATSTPTTLSGLIDLVADIDTQFRAHISEGDIMFHLVPDTTNIPTATGERKIEVILEWKKPVGVQTDVYA
jgi:hypothetical protein